MLPLVSCVCVTRNKPHLLARAIKCYHSQSYSNKELVIVYESDDKLTIDYLSTIVQTTDVHLIQVEVTPTKLTLGELRNLSIARCRGEYFCQWDDDDWYHPDRIRLQLKTAVKENHPATMLTNWFIYDEIRSQAYLSRYRLWEGSILCKRSIITDKLCYPSVAKAEDSRFLDLLLINSRVYPMVMPYLYLYTYNGSNTWEETHFDTMFSRSQKLNQKTSKLFGEILNQKLSLDIAAKRLKSRQVYSELNYFYLDKITLETEKISQ